MDYQRQITRALAQIQDRGQRVIWRTVENAPPVNADEPWKPNGLITVDKTVYIVFLPIKRIGFETLLLRNGMDVPKGNLAGIMGAVDFTPALKDVIIRNGVQLHVCKVDPLAPNGTTILYKLEFES
jgi:hypothetical protein